MRASISFCLSPAGLLFIFIFSFPACPILHFSFTLVPPPFLLSSSRAISHSFFSSLLSLAPSFHCYCLPPFLFFLPNPFFYFMFTALPYDHFLFFIAILLLSLSFFFHSSVLYSLLFLSSFSSAPELWVSLMPMQSLMEEHSANPQLAETATVNPCGFLL